MKRAMSLYKSEMEKGKCGLFGKGGLQKSGVRVQYLPCTQKHPTLNKGRDGREISHQKRCYWKNSSWSLQVSVMSSREIYLNNTNEW